jgi:hypothetical protein
MTTTVSLSFAALTIDCADPARPRTVGVSSLSL